MTIGLEKLVQDIKNETVIWPIENSKNSAEEDAAWDRVGARNKMSGNHVKSIFKVLSKKYSTEKLKPKSNWKLFQFLTFLDQKSEIEEDDDDIADDGDIEDDGEFVELLEVNEYDESDDEENESSHSPSYNSMEEEPQKSQLKSTSPEKSKEINVSRQSRHEKTPNQSKLKNIEIKKPTSAHNTSKTNTQIKKIHSAPTSSSSLASHSVSRNIKNNVSLAEKEETRKQQYEAARNQMQQLQQKKQRSVLSDSLKRKYTNDSQSDGGKKDNAVLTPPFKKEAKEYIPPQGLKIERISINPTRKSLDSVSKDNSLIMNETSDKPLSPTADKNLDSKNNLKYTITPQFNTVIPNPAPQVTCQNGVQNSRIVEIKREILDYEMDAQQQQQTIAETSSASENILPAFFRDLYNSKQYDCFGMYVASAMNRLPIHLAPQLEAKILSAIIEINSVANGSTANY